MGSPIVYTGTFTGGKSIGIYAWKLDTGTGELSSAAPPAVAENPAYLAWGRPDRLYCVCESPSFHGEYGGGVASFAVGPGEGNLQPLNSQPTHGISPCYLSVDPSGRFLLTAQYREGTVSVFPLRADGSIGPCRCTVRHTGTAGPVAGRQAKPHAHCIRFTPDGRLVLAVDLGIDRVKAYRLEAESGTLLPARELDVTLRPGSGPRHIAFSPRGDFLYVICEICSEIAVFRKADEGYEPVQYISTLPAGWRGENTAAALRFFPGGKFLYASNRGHDSIAVFEPSRRDGTLTPLGFTPCGGAGPRDFNIEPGGRYLLCANQYSDDIVSFAVDAQTGALTPASRKATVGTPVCLLF